jgi:hypothetical protein
METTVEFLDIREFVSRQIIPTAVLNHEQGQHWFVRKKPLDFMALPPRRTDEAAIVDQFAFIRKGDLVKIPLCPYRTSQQDLSQLVAVAMDSAARDVQVFPNAIRCHLVVGSPVEILQEHNAFRYWVGIAFREK